MSGEQSLEYNDETSIRGLEVENDCARACLEDDTSKWMKNNKMATCPRLNSEN